MAEEVINNAALYLSLLAVLAVSMFVGRQGVESTEDYVHALRGTVSEWRWLGLNIFSAGIGLWSFITIPEGEERGS